MSDRFELWGPDALTTYWPVRALREQGLYFNNEAIEEYLPGNRVRVAGHGEMLMMGGYSYLGLNRHPRIDDAVQRAVEHYGTGCHGTRMLAGTLELHRQLERTIASFVGTEKAMTFSSGFFANVSTITALLGRHDIVISDKLNHASIVDGCLLSGATHLRFRHNDMAHLEQQLLAGTSAPRRLVVVDGVFSMDGDIAPLPEIVRLCRRYDAILMVDEAHSLGVIGATGRGIEEHFGLPAGSIDIKMGTLSKTIPSSGGYIAGSARLIDFLSHQARGFIYSGAINPASAAAALAALEVMADEPERVTRLHDMTRLMASMLTELGLSYLDSETAIFPVICGDDWNSFHMAQACRDRGVFVQAIPHPVVPKGLARLRVAVNATHTCEDLVRFADILRDAADEVGIPRMAPKALAA